MGARGKIFVSYRRDDAPGDARGIRDRLASKFGKANVFMDVDNLLAGQRFDRELEKALSQCDVLIAVIGARWMKLLSSHARSGDRDYVHDEIAAALKRDITVIPTLVGRKGHMPSLPQEANLPEDIRALVLHHKQDIAHESFGRDADELVEAVKFVRRGGRPAISGRTIAVSGATVFALATGLLGYWLAATLLPGVDPGVSRPDVSAARSNPDATRAAADEAAKNKAAEEEASKKAAEAKRQSDADAAKKAEQEVKRQAEAEAVRKKTEEEAAKKKAEEDGARKKVEADAAKRKADEEALNRKAAADCDRLAASRFDNTLPNGVAAVGLNEIDAAAATAACNDAMLRNPELTRMVYQAGRAADARKDYAKAVALYGIAAGKGSAAAMTELGAMYYAGRGVNQDYAEAGKWYEQAAALGVSAAMNDFGDLYYYGRGVPQSFAEARKWYEKAAALGSVVSMSNLGILYHNGSGVTQDYAEARKWYEKAAAFDEPFAIVNLGVLYEVGRNYADARKWYERAAALGQSRAMHYLGDLYYYGRGVGEDAAQARKWYQKAADAGDEGAKTKLKNLK